MIELNGRVIRQPDTGLEYDFETTYTEDSTRTQSGVGVFTTMFTVEALKYSASNLTVEEVRDILQIVAKGNSYQLKYFSFYYGRWRTDLFYTGKGSLNVGELDENTGLIDNLSFSMIGVNPIT